MFRKSRILVLLILSGGCCCCGVVDSGVATATLPLLTTQVPCVVVSTGHGLLAVVVVVAVGPPLLVVLLLPTILLVTGRSFFLFPPLAGECEDEPPPEWSLIELPLRLVVVTNTVLCLVIVAVVVDGPLLDGCVVTGVDVVRWWLLLLLWTTGTILTLVLHTVGMVCDVDVVTTLLLHSPLETDTLPLAERRRGC